MFLIVFALQIVVSAFAQASSIDLGLEASSLKNGYAIRLLKPLPRRNSGCETIFRSGRVLETCDPNYGFDPAIEGVFRTYCEWNLNTHYQKNNSSKWLEPYTNPDLIEITDAKVGFSNYDEYRTYLQKLGKRVYITYRWIELEFKDGITGSKLGSLKCYPSQAYEYLPSKEKLFGRYYYYFDLSYADNASGIKSGLSIGNVLDQLKGYVELIKLNH